MNLPCPWSKHHNIHRKTNILPQVLLLSIGKLFRKHKITNHSGDLGQRSNARLILQQTNNSRLSISLFISIKQHSQAQQTLIKLDESIIRVKILRYFGDLQWQLQDLSRWFYHYKRNTLIFTEDVVTVIRQKVTNLVTFVADLLEPIRLTCLDRRVVACHLWRYLLH